MTSIAGPGPGRADRFAAVAAQYDAVRPAPPTDLADLLRHWAGTPGPDVVDLGAGTGLSAVLWAGRARTVTAVEPSGPMRALAARRIGVARAQAPGTSLVLRDGTAEHTGLPGGCADIVTASQALHWFDPARALPEAARLLRPGGVFAAYDCDWPPCVDPLADAAFSAVLEQVSLLERRHRMPVAHRGKEHQAALRGCGLFGHVREMAVHGRDQGGADRLVALAESAAGTLGQLRAAGMSEDDLGMTRLREVAAARLGTPRPWYWSYRVHLAVR